MTVAGLASPVARPVLEVRDLSVSYSARSARKPPVRAVRGVSLQLGRGEAVGLVGESGCGKSSLARALTGLEPATGQITLGGVPLAPAAAGTRRGGSRSCSRTPTPA